mmetsp:Transcript_5018/g.16201  ORF Transcript_5018/g.16201 Transcript_5018/m.16201 type:complete len:228 (+) Transcript_5018:1231-1914(+)
MSLHPRVQILLVEGPQLVLRHLHRRLGRTHGQDESSEHRHREAKARNTADGGKARVRPRVGDTRVNECLQLTLRHEVKVKVDAGKVFQCHGAHLRHIQHPVVERVSVMVLLRAQRVRHAVERVRDRASPVVERTCAVPLNRAVQHRVTQRPVRRLHVNLGTHAHLAVLAGQQLLPQRKVLFDRVLAGLRLNAVVPLRRHGLCVHLVTVRVAILDRLLHVLLNLWKVV